MTVGQLPQNGFELMEGRYVKGIANGRNFGYQYAITAAGTNQATAAALPGDTMLVEVDTAASGTGVYLPFAIAGTEIHLYNNGANTVTVYPNVNNNPLTSAQDTINNTTDITVTTHTAEIFFCAKNGVWAAK